MQFEFLLPWSTECIKQDYCKHFLSTVPRFDGFCLVPNHLDYKRESKLLQPLPSLLHQPLPEIPCFIHHLIQTSPHTKTQLCTPALKRVKRYNRNKLEVEMTQILYQLLILRKMSKKYNSAYQTFRTG